MVLSVALHNCRASAPLPLRIRSAPRLVTLCPLACGHGHLQGLANPPRADDSSPVPGTLVQKNPRFVQNPLPKFVQNKN